MMAYTQVSPIIVTARAQQRSGVNVRRVGGLKS
jgi:hypothetical protein